MKGQPDMTAPKIKFPVLGLAGLCFSLLALLALHLINTKYCAFGFGGFQCTSPFLGWGSFLISLSLLFLMLIQVFLAISLWQVLHWFRLTRSRSA